MTTLRKMVAVELKLFLREPLTVVFALALPLITLFVLGGVFGNTPEAGFYAGVGAMDFYTPAYIGLVLASIGVISIPAHLAGNRERGVLRRFRASSVPAAVVVGSEVAVSLLIALVSGVVLVACALVMYGAAPPQSAWLLMPAFLLSGLVFATLGAMLGTLLPTARAAQAAGMLLWFVMLFLGGAGPPPEVLTGALGWLRHGVPLTYSVGVLQGPWLGTGWNWADAGILAAIGLAAALVTALRFRWE
ncbi:MAG: ABC transporter permease [Actinobacteria bacterium]|nr:ABC transporter permease [Actinomycetota bacterium]